MTGNDDFFSLGYTFEQGGQMGLGFKSAYSNHIHTHRSGLNLKPVYHAVLFLRFCSVNHDIIQYICLQKEAIKPFFPKFGIKTILAFLSDVHVKSTVTTKSAFVVNVWINEKNSVLSLKP
ncbi:MAG: hypothetical protein H6940_11860 [Burkholderiales bacterium]|nr:hypothetical protein [Burkholderiales bacterium]